MVIFVSNLSYGVDGDELLPHFAGYGEVISINVATDKFTNQSKGFAFVEMKEQDAAEKAIAGLNGFSIAGRAMRVQESKPREERPAKRSTGKFY